MQRQMTRIAHMSGKNKERYGRLTERLTHLTSFDEDVLEKILDENPLFYENRNTETNIQLDTRIAAAIPPEAREDMTEWIESLPRIERGQLTGEHMPHGQTIRELTYKPYDMSKVKMVELQTEEGEILPVVIKRLNRDELTEPERAKQAAEAGIPTPQVFGTVHDSGNTYMFTEYIPSISLFELELLAARCKPTIHSSFQDFMYEVNTRTQLHNFPEIQSAFIEQYKKTHKYLVAEFILISVLIIKNILGKTHEHAQAAVRESIKERIQSGSWSIEIVDQALEAIGIETIDEITARIPYNDDGSADIDRIRNEYYPFVEKIKDKMRAKRLYGKELMHIFERYCTGATVAEHQERLQQACDAAGIQHGDIAGRNVIVEWNLESNTPLRDKQPRVMLIDWTEKET